MNESLNIKTLGSGQEIDFIQHEIEIYTKKIEHEKINLHLAKERHEKQLSNLLTLQGMPIVFKSKEQKEKEKKERKEKKKQKKPLYEAKPIVPKNELAKSNPSLFSKEIGKNDLELDKLTSEINQLLLENKDLKKQNEDLRKEKRSATILLEDLRNKKETVKQKISYVIDSNKEIINQIKFTELKKAVKEEYENKTKFEHTRDGLEEKYHQIIEENIRRERDLKKETLKNRNMLNSNVSIRNEIEKDNMGENTTNGSRSMNEDNRKNLEDEDISDRTPILDVLNEKWKFYYKYKKNMLDRYCKNAISIKDAFDKMMKFLGTDDFHDLPMVLEKMEDQMSSIEMYISNLTNQIDLLDDKKRLIQFRIDSLTHKINLKNNVKDKFSENKHSRIEQLKNHIAELKQDIETKRMFFVKLQPMTNHFISEIGQSYLSEFIFEKIAVNLDVNYNEFSISEILANVEDYSMLISEFEKSSSIAYKRGSVSNINIEIEDLKREMRIKIDQQFKKDNYNDVHSILKTHSNTNVSNTFDETIKKMADEFLKQINLQGSPTSKKNK